MSRARNIANADTTHAPLASPTFTGTTTSAGLRLSGGAIEQSDGTDLLTETGVLDNVALGSAVTGFFSSNVGFRAYCSSGSWVEGMGDGEVCVFDAERFDNGDVYNHTSSTVGTISAYSFEAPADGLYFFSATISTALSDSHNSFGFMKNGVEDMNITGSYDPNYGHSMHSTTDDVFLNFSDVYYLSSGDEICVGSFMTSSDFNSAYSFWSGCRIF